MLTTPTKPLIACASRENVFRNTIHAAANEMGTDFLSADDIQSLYQETNNRQLSCAVIDFENTDGLEDHMLDRPFKESHPMIAAVAPGDVYAAFNAASIGAVNVIEKPLQPQVLVTNLKTALASETRVEEYRHSDLRFSNAAFDCLTTREKTVLRLLMDGEQNKQVAAILDIGLRTAESARAQIMKKLGVSSFVNLIRLVTSIENDILSARKKIFGKMLPR